MRARGGVAGWAGLLSTPDSESSLNHSEAGANCRPAPQRHSASQTPAFTTGECKETGDIAVPGSVRPNRMRWPD